VSEYHVEFMVLMHWELNHVLSFLIVVELMHYHSTNLILFPCCGV
jgi:hypothetical protein